MVVSMEHERYPQMAGVGYRSTTREVPCPLCPGRIVVADDGALYAYGSCTCPRSGLRGLYRLLRPWSRQAKGVRYDE